MSTRYLIAALLMTSACVAHADVATSTPASSGFLSSWTTGNGSSVIGSGVLNDASLIGGVANGSSPSLSQALYQKASANAAQTGGVMKISYSQGIDGMYLTSTSNAMLVAMLGDNVSAVSSPDGAIITTGSQSSGNQAPAGGMPVSAGGGGGTSSLGSGGGGSTGTGTGTSGLGDLGHSGAGSTSGNGGLLSDSGTTPVVPVKAEPLDDGQPTNKLPEPSSIALLAVGLFGAAGLRRRSRR